MAGDPAAGAGELLASRDSWQAAGLELGRDVTIRRVPIAGRAGDLEVVAEHPAGEPAPV